MELGSTQQQPVDLFGGKIPMPRAMRTNPRPYGPHRAIRDNAGAGLALPGSGRAPLAGSPGRLPNRRPVVFIGQPGSAGCSRVRLSGNRLPRPARIGSRMEVLS